jgi:D-alanyl-lipoteichoic acid acyltransferase DltB (MBOAT superfamily)
MATVGQALVIYLDFSGYTDLVLGMSLLLGFDIVENFNFPYTSKNITEYWRRWHMSLSRWLNEYLYFPLSFALRKYRKTGTVIAVFITFVISGFWHDTAFHYTFWGMLHGVALAWDIASANFRDFLKKYIPSPIYAFISVLLTFSFLALSGIFFKARTMEAGMEMIKHIFTKPEFHFFGDWFTHYPWIFSIIICVLLLQFVFQLVYEDTVNWFQKLPAAVLSIILVGTIFLVYQVSGMESLPFIYLDH